MVWFYVGYLLVIAGFVIGIAFDCCFCLLTFLLVIWLCLFASGSADVVSVVFNVAYSYVCCYCFRLLDLCSQCLGVGLWLCNGC